MKRSSFLLVSVSVVVLFATSAHAQTQENQWFSLRGSSDPPLPRAIDELAFDALRKEYTVTSSSVAPADLPGLLAKRSRKDVIFVTGRPADIVAFIRNDQTELASQLGLEIVNARLGVTPLYLFTNARKQGNIKPGNAPRVVYASQPGAIQQDQVRGLFTATLNLLRMTAAQPTFTPAAFDADVLAGLLLSDNDGAAAADVVAIHDEDPSPFLNRFITAYGMQRRTVLGATDDQHSLQMLVVPTAAPKNSPVVNQVQQSGALSFSLVRFEDVVFDELERVAPKAKDGVLAVTGGSIDDTTSLLMLSNVRSVVNNEAYQRLRRTLGDAYFLGLMTNIDFRTRCRGSSTAYSSYLLDAQLSDRMNLAKTLAFWSDIVLRTGAGSSADRDRAKQQLVIVEQELSDRDVHPGNRDDIAKELQGSRAGMRERFSNQSASLFNQALGDLLLARQSSDPAKRASFLALARAKLVALIKRGDGPLCSGADGGLFGRGLDPFFYLHVIDAYAALQSPTAALPALPR